ncbi:hypothetical protein B0H11DRAFT_1905203 [Mycena galericulata]|nr:hypothetical protein B0H11DRAFT_1905203 [Mycena galericulata]
MVESGGQCSRTGGWSGLTAKFGLTACLGVLTALQVLDNAGELELEMRGLGLRRRRDAGWCAELELACVSDGRGVETGAREAKAEEGWEAEQARGQRKGGRREGKETTGSTCDQSANTRRQRARTKHTATRSPRPHNALAKPLHPAADTPLRPSGWHRREALPPSLTCLHGVELVQVAHAPVNGNDGPTGSTSGRRVDTKKLGVKHFVYAGGLLRKTETYNPHCVADTWLAVLHDPGTYMGRMMYVTRESPTPRELEVGGREVFGTEQSLDDVLLQYSSNGFPYP